ncbi:MAG TPA: D-aminoacylase, partial [Vicinamibacteria bacterium]|nr:D-aminoacylase [Vicinamibacteria bacterium]
HSDLRVLAEPDLPMKLRQGITLEVFGQDGISVAPVRPEDQQTWKQKLSGLLGDFGVEWDWGTVAGYLDRVRQARPAQDVAYLAPHGALRQYAMGPEARRAGETELTHMQALLQQALSEGACGMSTGLIYPPCCYADTAELVALGQVLAEVGRPLVVHMRSESDEIEDAVEEMLTVARESGCPVHISHLKLAGRDNWGKAQDLVERLELARLEGLQITADQYPYAAGSTMLGAILPPWAHDGGTPATLARLADPAARQRMRDQMADPRPAEWDNFWKWSGPEGIVVSDIPSGRHPEWLGRHLADIAQVQDKDPFQAAFDLLLDERMGVAMVSFSQDEEVVERFMRLPFVNVCTDGLLGGRPHPRAYGTYPRVLARYVRERGTLTLEQAVRKMTARAAQAFRLGDVGFLRPGYRANVVAFDAATVHDRATFEDPLQYPLGIQHVVIGGEPVLRDAEETGARPGQVVR